MASYRVAQFKWKGVNTIYIRTSSAILQGKLTETLFEKYKKDGEVVIISIEDKGIIIHHGNSDHVTNVMKNVDVSRLPYGQAENI